MNAETPRTPRSDCKKRKRRAHLCWRTWSWHGSSSSSLFLGVLGVLAFIYRIAKSAGACNTAFAPRGEHVRYMFSPSQAEIRQATAAGTASRAAGENECVTPDRRGPADATTGGRISRSVEGVVRLGWDYVRARMPQSLPAASAPPPPPHRLRRRLPIIGYCPLRRDGSSNFQSSRLQSSNFGIIFAPHAEV